MSFALPPRVVKRNKVSENRPSGPVDPQANTLNARKAVLRTCHGRTVEERIV